MKSSEVIDEIEDLVTPVAGGNPDDAVNICLAVFNLIEKYRESDADDEDESDEEEENQPEEEP